MITALPRLLKSNYVLDKQEWQHTQERGWKKSELYISVVDAMTQPKCYKDDSIHKSKDSLIKLYLIVLEI